MSKADKMFEELGYEAEEMKDKWDRVWGISYKEKKRWVEIQIDYIDAEICVGTININDRDSEPVFIGIQELKAINKKCEELGWIK